VSWPSNWNKVKFGEIAKRKSVRINKPKDSGYEKYVGLEHLDPGALIVKRWGSSQDVSSSMQLFNKNDILFARRNTYLRRVSVALFDGVCSGDIIVIDPILKHIVDGFLPIFMQFEEFENRVIAWSAGAFSKRVKWKQLSSFEVWLPPKEDQQKIVDTIWSIQLSQEKAENIVEVAEKLKKGLLEELLTKGIGHRRFKKTELGELPEEWFVTRFEAILSEGPRNGIYKSKEYRGYGVKMVNMKEMFQYGLIGNPEMDRVYLNASEYERFLIKPGDLLFARRSLVEAGAGKCCLVIGDEPRTFESSIIRIRVGNNVEPKFLYYLFNSNVGRTYLRRIIRKVAVSGITGKDLLKLVIALPEKPEQKRIVNKIQSVEQNLDNLRSYLYSVRNLRNKLGNSFLSGELFAPKEAMN
jgi:type I restriction enzyme S subunit